jgi:hypothetical protein
MPTPDVRWFPGYSAKLGRFLCSFVGSFFFWRYLNGLLSYRFSLSILAGVPESVWVADCADVGQRNAN